MQTADGRLDSRRGAIMWWKILLIVLILILVAWAAMMTILSADLAPAG